jgi:hypothetical protein
LREFLDQLRKLGGVRRGLEVGLLDRDPANSSEVIEGNISSATACMPSLAKDADATTSLPTTAGWRIASCSATLPPML